MNQRLRKIFILLAPGAVALAATIALWGCKEHSAAQAPESLPPAPVLHAEAAVGDNPLTLELYNSPFWKKAVWSPLVAPLNDTRTAPPTQVACAYDAKNLYVAFVCADSDVFAATPKAQPWERDSVEVWLDTATPPKSEAAHPTPALRAAGCEVFRVIVTPQGQAAAYWYRCAAPPRPREDGTPDFAHPISTIPRSMPGLQVKVGSGVVGGQGAWTLILALPLNELPAPLQTRPQAGARWHANLIRNDWIRTPEGKRELAQSNFSPVYPSAQAVSPYRMAELLLDDDKDLFLTQHAAR